MRFYTPFNYLICQLKCECGSHSLDSTLNMCTLLNSHENSQRERERESEREDKVNLSYISYINREREEERVRGEIFFSVISSKVSSGSLF